MLNLNKEKTAIPFKNHSGKCKIGLNRLFTLIGVIEPRLLLELKYIRTCLYFRIS